MSEEEFNQTVKETSNDFRNKQPDEFEHPVEIHQYEEDNRKLPSNPKKGSKKPSASSFLFLVVGASVTVGGIGIAIPELVNNNVDIKIENIESDQVTFSFVSNSNDFSARVYNDFEDISCKVEYVAQNEEDKYIGYGVCESLRENTDYTISVDGTTVLGNASRGKKSFRTEKKPAIIKELSLIEITGELIKKDYIEGEIFDPSGLKVTAEFTTGEKEDVTNLSSWSTAPLTLNDTFVTVSYTYNEITKTAEYSNFTVNSAFIPVTGVKLNETNLELIVDDTFLLEATVLPSDATNKNVTFASTNDAVATVNSNGLIVATGVGKAIVSAKTEDGEFTAGCIVNVKSNVVSVTGVEFNDNTLELNIDQETTLEYSVLPSNATNKNVTFTSSNPQCVTVTNDGIARAYSYGEATITVKTVDGGFEDRLTIIVPSPWQRNVEVSSTFECMNENILHYTIDAKEEIYNISNFKFSYYTLDDELIETIVKGIDNPPAGSTVAEFYVDVSGIQADTYYVIIFVTRNGEEEALGYSEQYTPREMFTHPEDIVVQTDNSLIDQNKILYFNLVMDDPYEFYSNLHAELIGPQQTFSVAIIDEGSVTTGYFYLSGNNYFPVVANATLQVYIEYSGEEYQIFNGTVDLYKSISIATLAENIEVNITQSANILFISVNTDFYDYVGDYGDYICETVNQNGEVVDSKNYVNKETNIFYSFDNAPIMQGETYDFNLYVMYKGTKTLLKTIENVINV